MSSKSVSKVVAKKLKYYLDVRRKEDAFDLSGPYLPAEDPTPLRAGPTLAYDGIHDRSLKHYYRSNDIKKQLQHMRTPQNMHRSREKAIRHYVDTTMASIDYRLKPGPISPYAFPQTVRPRPPPHRPKALMTVDEYLRTRRGSKRRKMPVHIVGKPRRIARRSPPQHIEKNERERLVNMASRLIVATETVALPQQKMQSKGFQANEEELPQLHSRRGGSGSDSPFTSGHESESSHDAKRPAPPRNKPSSARRRPQSTFFKSSSFDSPSSTKGASGVHVVLPGGAETDTDKMKYLMDRMNLDGRGTSVMASPRQSDSRRPKSAGHPLKSTANTSTGVPPDPSYDYDDDFYSDEDSSRPSPSPRMSWMESDHDKNDMSTQTVVHSGTQTKFVELNDGPIEREVYIPSKLTWADRASNDTAETRQPVAVATVGVATANEPTNVATATETQTRNRDLEPKVITYEVYVKTGDRLGAGTKATIKITIFGEYGNSGERHLLRSRTHRSKFQRGQVDVFVIDSLFLGRIISVRVGHNETRLGYGWFLDKVYVKEGVEATRAFEFKCNRWFSSCDGDGQIMRDLPVYDVVPASHIAAILPKEQERSDEFFHSPSDSETTRSDGETTRSDVEETPREYDRRPSYSKTKTKNKKTKSKLAKPEPVDQPDGFREVRAENLFEVSDDENGDEEDYRFFEPDEEESASELSDEEVVNRKPLEKTTTKKTPVPAKERPGTKVRQFPNLLAAVKREKTNVKKEQAKVEAEMKSREEDEEEEVSAEEERRKEESDVSPEEARSSEEETRNKDSKHKGASQLRLISTAVSPFLKMNRRPAPQPKQPSPINEEPSPEPEMTTQKDESDDEDEPEVEFTPETKKEVERPSSARSDEYDEGFRAGIRKKQQEERMRHRASVTESENILTTGPSIHDAAKQGDLARIKELIGVASSMKNVPDEKGMTALHIASSNGHLGCVKWLAVSGVDLGQETPTGYTAIHLAAMGGHVNCMMILSAMGSVINCKTIDALTPLHLAAMSGHLECVKWLLANRSRTDSEDSNGRTALDIAEEYGHEAIIKLLRKFKKELTRQDSTLAQLMKAESKRRKSLDSIASDNDGAPSKVSDSGVGGMESEEDNWISDTEEDATEEGETKNKPAETGPKRAPERPDSASRSRTDSIVSAEEKKTLFEKQRKKMKKRNSSFLDSIRMDVENDEEDF